VDGAPGEGAGAAVGGELLAQFFGEHYRNIGWEGVGARGVGYPQLIPRW
jgi:hypothetical protein